MYFDTTRVPVWFKTFGDEEVDTLTVTTGATTAGNITIALNSVDVVVAIAAEDTVADVAGKRATAFEGWTVGGQDDIVIFTKAINGVCAVPTFNRHRKLQVRQEHLLLQPQERLMYGLILRERVYNIA